MAKKLFTQHPYDIDIWMCTSRKSFSKLNKKFKLGVKKITKDIDGFTVSNMGNKGKPLVICVLTDDISVVAHECFHAINLLSEYFILPNDSNSDEPNAYLIGALVKAMSRLL